MLLEVKKLRQLLPVWGRGFAPSKPSNARPAFSTLPQPGHPERSWIIREADDPAQSKDPYPVRRLPWLLISPALRAGWAAMLSIQ
jgi:hypothetical protein